MRNSGAKRVYFIAAVISIVLYAAGVGTGYYLQGDISGLVEGQIGEVRKDISTVEQELPLLSMRGEGSCSVLSTLSSDVNAKIDSILGKIVDLEQRGASKEVYDSLLGDYTSLAVRGWILSKDIQQSCIDNSVPVLYFYSVPCDDCIDQGRIIDVLKEKYGEKLQVFAINHQIDQSSVRILAKSFGIDRTPAILIESRTFQGLVSEDALDKMVCTKLKSC
ncbi:MAG: thioredoxin family protein [Candidatus Aenigmarchaeota archaeon]|nr:thioredoxin family protein [Candidatus Aenigmarchaeota archaeon]